MKYKQICIALSFLLFILFTGFKSQNGNTNPNAIALMGNRFLTFNAVIRVNQIEVSRFKNVGEDERSLHTPLRVTKFREAIDKGCPGARIT